MASAPDDNSLLLDQNVNWFLVQARIEPKSLNYLELYSMLQ